MNSNPELDLTVAEDIDHLNNLWQKDNVTNADLRNSSHILRRLLIYQDLQKCANPRKHALYLESPNNKTLITAARNQAIEFFQSGGTTILGVWFRASTVAKGNNEKLSRIFKGFNPEEKIYLNLSSFLRQPVFYLDNTLISRADVIKYVANKAGGPHFDSKRNDKERVIDKIRRVVIMRLEDDIPTFRFDVTRLQGDLANFEIIKGSIDAVFVEMAAACRFLTESESVVSLVSAIQVEHRLTNNTS